MKNILAVFCLLVFINKLSAQNEYWQQQTNFTITVSLNDNDHTLNAFETIEYINNSPDTLNFIWFHIWPNAYKNDMSAFSEQLLQERRLDFYYSSAERRGYINQLDFKVDGSNAKILAECANIDIVKVLLPRPLAPKGKTIITTPFKVKLPFNFSRGGHIGKDCQVTQWFPKPAVYDRKGWHSMPYLDQGEFYSEFGNFDVDITVPSAYVVAATGVLQDAETLQQLKELGKHTLGDSQTKTWHYKQDNVHDFAWFASEDFVVKYDTAILPSKKVVDVFVYTKGKTKGWNTSTTYAKDAIHKYSSLVGEYPYLLVSVVEGAANVNSGGMEYPTITLITTKEINKELDITITHEIGHNWFYGALATNERDHPWMDEGINTYYEKRYEGDKYSDSSSLRKSSSDWQNKFPSDEAAMLLSTIVKLNKDQPIETPAEKFTSTNYGLIIYYKASQWMKKLEGALGKEVFDKCMQAYYNDWKFKHPYPEDFKASIEKTSGRNLDTVFTLLHKTGSSTTSTSRTIKPSFLFNLDDKYHYINFAPAVGYNNYDKEMVGAFIHNYTLPLPNLQFVAGALYGTGSKKLNVFGRVSQNIYRRYYNISTALSYISYSKDDFITADKTTLILRIKRLVPSINFTLFDKDPLSTRRFTAYWKTFLLSEGVLDFKSVITPNGPTASVKVVNNQSYINRLSVAVSNDRILFPYSLALGVDQGKEFLRLGVTGKLFFNYSEANAGLSARWFAGKFFYLTPKTFLSTYNNDRYLLNLSAPKGYEDYTYSDYFMGRHEFEGWQSQQVTERDGFFKVNTELLSNKVGKTDDWLIALNLVSDVGKKAFPIKLFFDAGTYAEAWKNNSTSGRFLYDAGIELQLFKSLVNIHIPLFYSKVYKDYYKSTITENRFVKAISFNVNLQKLQMREILKDLPL